MAKALQRANGTGSVYKLSGRRRNPWRAVITKGWAFNEDKGKLVQNRVTVGYFHTKDEAIQALANYNASPYDIQTNSITFEEFMSCGAGNIFPHWQISPAFEQSLPPIITALHYTKCE